MNRRVMQISACLYSILICISACKTTHVSSVPDAPGVANPAPGANAPAGDQDPTITFDVNNKHVDYGQLGDGYTRQDKYFKLKLTNFNPLLYKVSATNVLAINYTSGSAATSINNYVTLDAKTANNTTAPAAAPQARPISDDNPLKPKLNALLDIIKNLNDLITNINTDITSISDYYNTLSGCQSLINEWKGKTDLTQSIVAAALKRMSNNLGDNINTFYSNHDDIVNPFNANVIGTHDNFNLTADVLLNAPQKYLIIIQDEIKQLEDQINVLAKFKSDNSADFDQLMKSKDISDVIHYPDFDTYNKHLADVDTRFQKFITDYISNYAKNLSDIVSNVSLVKNLRFEETFGPYSIGSEDEMTIKVSAVNQQTNDDIFKNYPGIMVRRKKGIKIDFSAGIFGSGLQDYAFTTSQFTKIVQDTSVMNDTLHIAPKQATYSTIIRRKNASFSYGPMAFVHFHTMTDNWINFGGYIGTGFLFKDDSKPVMSFGFNALMGKYQRFIFGVGAVAGSVTRLSDKYQEGKSYAESITDVPTESQVKVSWLVSFSWNLSK